MAQAQTLRGYADRTLAVGRLLDPRQWAAIVVLVVLGFLVVVPLAVMVLASFRPAGVLPFDAGPLTFENYVRAFGGPDIVHIIVNTLIFAGGGVLLALPLAFAFAFLTERTDLPFRNTIYALMFIPMSVPIFATALGWVLLLGPRAGTINQYLRMIAGSDAASGPFNIFSLWGMVFVQALGVVPSMWLFLISVLRNMDRALEEAAAMSGANRWHVLTRVTGPLMRPAIVAVVIYFFISGIEHLELALALGPTAGIDVLSTKIYFTIQPSSNQGVDYGISGAFGMLGLALGVGGMALYLYLVRSAARYAVVAGKGYRPRMIPLGRWKYVALGALGLYMFIKVVLPFAMLVYTSLLPFYQPPVPDLFGSLRWTLANYAQLLDYRFFGRYFVNTILVAVGAATLTMVLVSVISWLVVRVPSLLTRLLNVVSFMPLAIPGVISTLAFFLLFIGTPVYGTLLLLALAFTARYIAYGTRLMHSAQLQIHRELEEASMMSGAGVVVTFLRINLWLLIPAFLNGWLWDLVHAAKDFSVALMLGSAGSLLVGNVIYGAYAGGRFPQASAMMVSLVLFNLLVVVLIGRKWIVGSLTEERQST